LIFITLKALKRKRLAGSTLAQDPKRLTKNAMKRRSKVFLFVTKEQQKTSGFLAPDG